MANCLPTEDMKENITESIEVMQKEGNYHQTIPGVISSQLDNFTDALMLVSCAHEEESGLIDRSMNIYRVDYEGKLSAETLCLYGKGEQGYTTSKYSRYWHGYQVFLIC